MLRRPPRIPAAVVTLFALGALWGCATSGQGDTRGSPDLIAQAEVDTQRFDNAYDLVARLRPTWLRARGTLSVENPDSSIPVVYYGSQRYGDPESLREISTDAVAEIRFLRGPAATTRFGTGHAGGVIHVIPRSG